MGMVLINDVTKEDINAALIRLQKQGGGSQGGGTTTQQTIQNIQIQNSGGSGSDLSSLYSMLSNMQKTIKEQGAKIEELEKSKTSLIQTTQQTVNNISDIQSILNSGITGDIIGVTFDNSTRIMSFNTTNGIFNIEVPETEIYKYSFTNEGSYLRVCHATNKSGYSGYPSFALLLTITERNIQTQQYGGFTRNNTYQYLIFIREESTFTTSGDIRHYVWTPYLKGFIIGDTNATGLIDYPPNIYIVRQSQTTQYATNQLLSYDIYIQGTSPGKSYSIMPLNDNNYDLTPTPISDSLTPLWTKADFFSIRPTVDEVAANNMQSVSSNAVYNAINEKDPVVIGSIVNNSGSTRYWKILNCIPSAGARNVLYTIQSRGGELIFLNIGDNDGNPTPKAKKITDNYAKVAGLRYSGTTVYIALASYSNATTIIRLCGNYATKATIQESTSSEYSTGTTAIPIAT